MIARWRKEATAWLVVLLLVGSVAGFAWLTRHPDAPWLERAEEWPVVGSLAQSFRSAYLGPPPGEEPEQQPERDVGSDVVGGVEPEGADAERVILGRPAPGRPIGVTEPTEPGEPLDLTGPMDPATPMDVSGSDEESVRRAAVDPAISGRDARSSSRERTRPPVMPLEPVLDRPRIRRIFERRWLLPGTVVRAEPAAGAAEIERTRELASVPMLERRAEWLRVQLRGRVGWADPVTPASDAHPLGRRALDHRYDAQPPTALLRQVRDLLDLRRPNRTVGPYALYTDIEDDGLLELLDGVAGRLDKAYAARYGLGVPQRRSGPVIALFAREADYRALVGAASTPHQHPNGFAVRGLAVFCAGDRPRQTLVPTLVHELTHALNRHALGSDLPVWLEEGMAGDLGTVWIEDPDAPAAGLVDAAVDRGQWRPQRILQVHEKTPVIGSYERLIGLEPRDFYDGTGVHQQHSLLLVRCLLDGPDPELSEGFRRFLYEVSAGLRITEQRLLDRLGGDWSEIGETCVGYRRTLQAESRRLLPAGWEWAEAR